VAASYKEGNKNFNCVMCRT